ncbi:hypothetical protein [Paenarthrobacter sp. NPDC089316]|uniref:hypothetical protein n=1 Tax=unclassified Paenarthrobacter TaxID=2634190 RepID=UPI00343A51E1
MTRVLTNPADDLCDFLLTALRVWSGPASSSDYFARKLDFADNTAFHSKRHSLVDALDSGEGLDFSDLPVAIRIARIAVTDDYYGAGWEWPIVTRFSVEESNAMLLALEAISEDRNG